MKLNQILLNKANLLRIDNEEFPVLTILDPNLRAEGLKSPQYHVFSKASAAVRSLPSFNFKPTQVRLQSRGSTSR